MRLIRSAIHLKDSKFHNVLVNRVAEVGNSSHKFVLNVAECECLIWECAKKALTSPHSVSVLGTAVVAFKVPAVLTLLPSVCAVPQAMTSAFLKFSTAFKE